MSTSSSTSPKEALAFVDFVNACPTPFHAVARGAEKLEAAGFTKIHERDSWVGLKAGKSYYFHRNASALIAFHLPEGYTSASPLALVATHVDSCALKIRPVSKNAKEGWERLAVETYGGGIWRTWWDRDLGVAGRVVCRVPAAAGSDSGDRWEGRLVKLDKAVARIPSLAIHLDPARDSFTFNKETQLYPLLGLSSLLNAPVPAGAEVATTAGVTDPMAGKHHPALLSLVAKELGVAVEDIADFELQLFDLQPAAIGGLADELILAGRIDNLMSSFCALEGLIAASSASSHGSAKGVPTAQAILLFDNEEVGSVSHQGAESSLLPNLAARLAAAGIGRSKDDAPVRAEEVLARSFLVSADMGHGVHPNYPEKHHDLHKPMLGGGVVIKTNANQRYTSNAATTFVLRRLAHLAGVPVQEFEVRNDSACGSTVGPGLSTVVRTVDIGLAQLSMHSIRETAGVADVKHYIDFMAAFLSRFGEVDGALTID